MVVALQHLESTVSCAGRIHCVVYVILGVTLYIVCHLSNLSNLWNFKDKLHEFFLNTLSYCMVNSIS